MRLYLALIIGKIVVFVTKLLGRGSVLPGYIVLKIFPDFFENVVRRKKVKIPVIAVTGSNGKTTTTDMLAHALTANGIKVGWNKEGANYTAGFATSILRLMRFSGKFKCDVLLLECDERYARMIFGVLPPTIVVVTNLVRDQLTRNGHHEVVQECIRAALTDEMTTILNADDPFVASLQTDTVVWYGVGKDVVAYNEAECYDDGAFCAVCKARVRYTYRIAGHLGDYRCQNCGHSRSGNLDFEITALTASGVQLQNGVTVALDFPNLNNAYNVTAAIAAASSVGVSPQKAAAALQGYALQNERTKRFTLEVPGSEAREGVFLLSKHENSVAYNQSLSWIVAQQKPCVVVIIVDVISRKYFTSETSWLWDINFDVLADDCVHTVMLSGRYVHELMARFALSKVAAEKLHCVPLLDLRRFIVEETTGAVYATTCFTDKDKFLNEVNPS